MHRERGSTAVSHEPRLRTLRAVCLTNCLPGPWKVAGKCICFNGSLIHSHSPARNLLSPKRHQHYALAESLVCLFFLGRCCIDETQLGLQLKNLKKKVLTSSPFSFLMIDSRAPGVITLSDQQMIRDQSLS